MSIRIYVGNLSKELEREEFEALFAEHEDLVSVKLITDKKTNKCRGFGFVTVKTDEQADAIIEQLNGKEFQGEALKLERAMPRKTKETAAPASTGGSRRKSGGKSQRGGTTAATTTTAAASSQPDPRWANDLAKLKELLAAQTANP